MGNASTSSFASLLITISRALSISVGWHGFALVEDQVVGTSSWHRKVGADVFE